MSDKFSMNLGFTSPPSSQRDSLFEGVCLSYALVSDGADVYGPVRRVLCGVSGPLRPGRCGGLQRPDQIGTV